MNVNYIVPRVEKSQADTWPLSASGRKVRFVRHFETHMTASKKPDRRVERTRLALLNAFRDLILGSGYDRMKVGDIISAADVGRSTFYEHFESKDDILKQSLSRPFGILADTVGKSYVPAHLVMMLEHFWENRRLARVVFSGTPRRVAARRLAELIEERLSAELRGGAKPVIPIPLVAAQLAEAQLGLIEAWVTGKPACSADALARALALGARAIVAALCGGPSS